MTQIRTSLIATFGLLVVGFAAPASAGTTVVTKPSIALSEVGGLHLATDRGSWAEPRNRRQGHYDRDRRYDRYDDHHHRKHYKKSKKRKHFKRGYRRGYDEGYYEGRRRSHYERRRHDHRRHRDYGFRGGIYFGDGYYGGPGFRFRY